MGFRRSPDSGGRLNAWISGAGTNLSFFPPDQPMELLTLEDFSPDRNQGAIGSIWARVGARIQASYDLVYKAEGKDTRDAEGRDLTK